MSEEWTRIEDTEGMEHAVMQAIIECEHLSISVSVGNVLQALRDKKEHVPASIEQIQEWTQKMVKDARFELNREWLKSGALGFVLWRINPDGSKNFYGGFQPENEAKAQEALRIMNHLVEIYKVNNEDWSD